ncbi:MULTISPECIES: lipopolysaccharide biosynthesis protein [Methylotenera]|uniref:lipopolysaccharide biosynthesis protein n=1 Tax=Methylotenera TaxID=359407 RepID=UPI0003675016|nr:MULTISPECIES: hypothetical protein [Methylotenera]
MNQITRLVGINQAVGFSLLARSWQIVAGPVTLLLVASYFNVAEQGFFYTFSSVLALQVLFELGLAFVINQFASHEFTLLSWGKSGDILGAKHAKDRMHAIIKHAVRWYLAVAILILLFVLPFGLYFFGKHEVVSLQVSWHLPWILLVFAAAMYLPIIPILAAIEGSGQVAQINRLRLVQGFFASLLTWAAIYGGLGLYAAAVTFLVNVLFSLTWMVRNYRILLVEAVFKKSSHNKSAFSWGKEVWPMQWRIAVSWVSGYFIFQLFTPILFYFHGPAIAGQMGMSLVVANVITIIPLIWLQANSPAMVKLVSNKNWPALDALYARVFWQSTMVSLIGVIVLSVLLYVFSAHPLIHRLLPLVDMIYLFVAFFLSHAIGALAHYLRMHKREPFMVLSLIGAVLTALSMWFFGRLYASTGMVISLMLINLVYGLPSALWLWNRSRKLWHN